MSIKKITISPDNIRAIKFFEDLDCKKTAFNKKAEDKLNKIIAANKKTSV